eukprot:gene2951-5752_t
MYAAVARSGILFPSNDQSPENQPNSPKSDETEKTERAHLPDKQFQRRIRQRRRQVNLGKASVEYKQLLLLERCSHKYKRKVFRIERPRTPDPYRPVSKRCFDGLLKQWRQTLHKRAKEHTSDINTLLEDKRAQRELKRMGPKSRNPQSKRGKLKKKECVSKNQQKQASQKQASQKQQSTTPAETTQHHHAQDQGHSQTSGSNQTSHQSHGS